MKFQLKAEESKYLNDRLHMIIVSAVKNKLGDKTLRLLHKMKYKFTPNALHIFLTRSERALLMDIIGFRQQRLAEENSYSEEMDLIHSIMRVIEL
jgi:hypothetical protein